MTSIDRPSRFVAALWLLLLATCSGNTATGDVTVLDTGRDPGQLADLTTDVGFTDPGHDPGADDPGLEADAPTDLRHDAVEDTRDTRDALDAVDATDTTDVADTTDAVAPTTCSGDDDCPAGWLCTEVMVQPPDAQWLCLPPTPVQCRPCAASDDCHDGAASVTAWCLPLGEVLGSFCGPRCGANDTCLQGFHCADATSAEGAAVRACVPDAGDCSCPEGLVDQGLSTACARTNAWGTCAGSRACVDGELSACSAATPATEACNGQDDDCDGQTDLADPDLNGTPRPLCEKQAGLCLGVQKPFALCTAAGWLPCTDDVYLAYSSAYAPGDPSTGLGADASCNGVDNDCDGFTDEGFEQAPSTCGVGACAATGTRACVGGHPIDSCAPGSPAAGDGTCDGIDDDCNGLTDDGYPVSATTCGTGACASSGQRACVGGAVVDSCAPGSPAASDSTCDGVDDDCNGLTDDGFVPSATACGTGACAAAGTTSCTQGLVHDSCVPGEPAVADLTCDGLDDDCNGGTDDSYVSVGVSCGVGACQATGTTTCVDGVEGDSCQPADGSGVDDACNGLDDDCDGVADDDYLPSPTTCGVGACATTGQRTCVGGAEVDSCNPGVPAADDVTCDGQDDDCDGVADEDHVASDTTCGVGACARPGVLACVQGLATDTCAPGQPAADDATCDGQDDDCDGATDEEYAPRAVACGVGACQATGTTTCVAGVEGDSCQPLGGAGADTVCNGVDDDCDGAIDDDYVPSDTTCGVGACASVGQKACVEGVAVDSCVAGTPAPSDTTCDRVDDDCNGLVDDGWQATATTCGVGACLRHGTLECQGGAPLDSCAAGTPAEGDASCNGVDDDCNGTADDGYVARTVTCGLGACQATGTTTCEQGTERDSCTAGNGAGTDSVCNGIDDDCDGQTDEDYVGNATTCGVGPCAATGGTSCVSGAVVDSCAPGLPSPEVCDGQDDDCDGLTDAGDADLTRPPSRDGHGGGGGAVPCELQAGVCAGVTKDPALCSGGAWATCTAGYYGSRVPAYRSAESATNCDALDNDCDGGTDEAYVAQATSCGVGACAATGTRSCVAGVEVDSCTPTAAAAHDTTCDGIDDDCNGQIDDGYVPRTVSCGTGACQATGTTVCDQGVERDSCTPAGGTSLDTVCNGLDDDCDGQTDEDYGTHPTACGVGACSAVGTRSCVKGVETNTCTPGLPAATDATCDGKDDDCNGQTDEDFVMTDTTCGTGACAAAGKRTCVAGVAVDSCLAGAKTGDDTDCDKVDDDCDGQTDEHYGTHATACGVGACAATGNRTCVAGVETNSCTPGLPAAKDATCDGRDDDCNGTADEDYVVTATACGTGACARAGQRTCVAGAVVDSCVAGPKTGDDTGCDKVDDDCDGFTDEHYAITDTTCGVGACASTGKKACSAGTEIDTCKPGTPAATDATCDGKDDDCDGFTDESYVPPTTTCGTGTCAATGQKACQGGHVVDTCTPGAPKAEVCNGKDDDCDGKTDAADPTDLLANDPRACETQVGACAGSTKPVSYCVGGTWAACDALVYAAWSTDYEQPEASCDGQDNDCDAAVDEGGATLCDDLNACTTDACGASACTHATDDAAACTGGYCQGGVCQPFVCTPDQPGCDGEVARTCNARGSGWLAGGVSCAAADKMCQAGACVEKCGALRFDGLGDYVEGPVASLLKPAKLTVEAWILPMSFPGQGLGEIASTADWTVGHSGGFVLKVSDGHPQVAIGNGTSFVYLDSALTVTLGQWSHVAAQYDGATITVYVNGQSGGSAACAGGIGTATQSLRIGDRSVDAESKRVGFDGVLDEVRISDVIRYASTFTPTTTATSDANTLLLYRFNEQAGTTTSDASSYSRTGTLQGASWVRESPKCHTASTCGNGIREGSEECDDGNALSWDGCTGCEIGEFRVNQTTAGTQEDSRVAAFDDGGFVVVWEGVDVNAAGQGVFMRRYDSVGAELNSETLVNAYTTSDQYQPGVETRADGGFVVTWTSNGQDGSDLGVYAQRYAANGAKADQEFRVTTATANAQSIPMITRLANDTMAIAWQSYVTATDLDVRARVFDASNGPIGAEIAVNTYTTGEQGYPFLTTLTDGRFLVTWNSLDQDGSGYGSYAQAFTAAGVKSGAEFRLNATTAGDQHVPRVSALSGGGFVAAWYSNCPAGGTCPAGVTDSSLEVSEGQLFDSSGARIGPEFQINSYTTSYQNYPFVVRAAEGGFTAAWRSFDQDGSDYGVFLRSFGADGSSRGGELRSNRYTLGAQRAVYGARNSDGTLMLTWTSDGQDGSGNGIYARLYDADGNPLLPGDTDRDGVPDGVDLDDDNDGSADSVDCGPKDAAIHPGAVEVCDAKDNDCDGLTDEGLTVPPSGSACPTVGVCQGLSLVATCTAGAWTCDYAGVANHEAVEATCDGRDNDCDGTTDEGGAALCDDVNACTDDTCKGGAGCGHTNNQGPCTSGYCSAGVCHPWVCTPDLPACDGTIARTCNASGSAFLDGGTNCATTGQVCAGGACVAPCHSVSFDGTSAYVQGPAGNLLVPAALTVEAWVRADTFNYLDNSDAVATADWTDGTARGYTLQFVRGVPSFTIGQGGINWAWARASEPVGTGAWVHVAGQYDGENVSIFVNGKLKSKKPAPGSISPPTLPLRVGGRAMGQYFFDGLIDEVRISKTIRYVADFAPATVLPSDADTLVLYHFSETSGIATADASGNGYGANLYGAAWDTTSPACATAVCVPGTKDCNGTVRRECGLLGDAWMSLHDCAASGQTCNAGACIGTATCCDVFDCTGLETCVANASAASCTLKSDTFRTSSSSFDTTTWAANGSVYHSTSGYASLTTTTGQAGSLWYRPLVAYCGLKLDFLYYVSSMVADGFAVVFQDGGNATAVGGGGGTLGAYGLTGVSVRFQYFNSSWYPVRLMRNSDNLEICTGTALAGTTGSHSLHVEVVAGRVKVTQSGVTYLDCDASAYLPANGGMVGWTAATGGFGSTQRLNDVVISAPCSGPGGLCQ
jgi:hypothetical protein